MSQENLEQLLLKGAELPNNVNLNAVYKAVEANPESVKASLDCLGAPQLLSSAITIPAPNRFFLKFFILTCILISNFI